MTLLELMVVLALIGILTSLAIGFSGNWRRQSEHRKLTREVFNALNVARAQALRRGVKVEVEFDDANHRLVVFEDKNANHAYDAGGDVRIHEYPRTTADLLELADVWDADMSVACSSQLLTDNHDGRQTVVFDHAGFSIQDDGSGSPLGLTDGDALVVEDTITGRSTKVEVTIAGAVAILPN